MYKLGDKVRIKDMNWYDRKKDKFGFWTRSLSGNTQVYFSEEMAKFCGKVLTIAAIEPENYAMVGNSYAWTNEMIEGLAEEGTNSDITQIVAQAEKRAYPTNYQECFEVMYGKTSPYGKQIVVKNDGYKGDAITSLQKLIFCRDAYWKLYSEEMELGEPWEPDWQDDTTHKFIIHTIKDKIHCGVSLVRNHLLAFPTEEMQDAFKKNFDPDIEFCKELL